LLKPPARPIPGWNSGGAAGAARRPRSGPAEPADNLIDRAIGDNLSLLEEDGALGQARGEGHVMRDQQERLRQTF